MASVEGQPGYRATRIQVFPYPSVPPYTFGDSFAVLAQRKKRNAKKENPKVSDVSRRISLARAAGASPLQPSLARLLLEETPTRKEHHETLKAESEIFEKLDAGPKGRCSLLRKKGRQTGKKTDRQKEKDRQTDRQRKTSTKQRDRQTDTHTDRSQEWRSQMLILH